MDKITEQKMHELEALSEELSGLLENKLKAVHALVRDTQLSLDTLSKIVGVQEQYDRVNLKKKAHDLVLRALDGLEKEEPDFQLIIQLLLTKSILIDPNDPGIKALNDAVKAMKAGQRVNISPQDVVV